MKLNSGAYYIPKNNSKYPQGGDDHFISDNPIGVADGVGSWFKCGIDSGEYSRQLMSNSLISIVEQVHFNTGPVRVLREASSNTNAQGSSTACILTLTNDKVQGLSAVNVGDTDFVQHFFNCPYQLSTGGNHDTPSSADILEFKEVMSGDVIVMGTDGLFDNLFTNEIEKIIVDAEEEATSRGGKINPNKVAWTLAEFSLKKSLDPNNLTPFAEAKKKDNSLSKGIGGKVDDITVIVSYVS
ncbi:hypothetical protein MKX03_026512 [Papaver bracteatum]|nr:hypothetical protein MKX03_026512 [Papaver bracteatum]